jgi:hypothetical protein
MWAQVINAALGVWLMAAPAVLGHGGAAAVNSRVVGPVVASFAIIAWWEATRAVRWVNLPLGLWLIFAPLALGYGAVAPSVNSVVVGALVASLAPVRGRVEGRFGGGWRAAWGRRPVHERGAREPS